MFIKLITIFFGLVLSISCMNEHLEGGNSCPKGFIKVPPLENYTMNPFCVAKYEMKSNLGQVVSMSGGLPWVMITRDHAKMVCSDMGEKYDLITNDEWQTLARNIESVSANWDQGFVGSMGGLNQGHSDNGPATVLAAGDDDNGCVGTEQICSESVWNGQRRVHILSNGEVIWDMAGNVWEWVQDDNVGIGHDSDSYLSQVTALSHITLYSLENKRFTTSRATKGQFGPNGDYTRFATNSLGGLGHGVLSSNGGGVVRGGYWHNGIKAGIFAVDLSYRSTDSYMTVGFRCVYQP